MGLTRFWNARHPKADWHDMVFAGSYRQPISNVSGRAPAPVLNERGHHTDTIWAEACLHAVSLSVGGMLLLDILDQPAGFPGSTQAARGCEPRQALPAGSGLFRVCLAGLPFSFLDPGKN